MLNYVIDKAAFTVTALAEDDAKVKVIVKLNCAQVPAIARSHNCKGAQFIADGILVCKGMRPCAHIRS